MRFAACIPQGDWPIIDDLMSCVDVILAVELDGRKCFSDVTHQW